MIVTVYTCIYRADYDIYFDYANRVGEGTVPLAIVLYIDGSFIKHKIPVKPIYVSVCNLNSVVSGKGCAWRVLGMMPSIRKSYTLAQTERTEGSGCITHVSATLYRRSTSLEVRISTFSVLMARYEYVYTRII
jgi:hypothetical protein